MDARNKLFISYSHEDTRWVKAIKEQLAVLEAEGLVSLCEDTQLVAGENWFEQLHEMMLSALRGRGQGTDIGGRGERDRGAR